MVLLYFFCVYSINRGEFMNSLVYAVRSTDEVLSEFNSSLDGLSAQKAYELQKKFGANVLSGRKTHWYDILIRQFKSPFLYLLIGAPVISFVLGEMLDGL